MAPKEAEQIDDECTALEIVGPAQVVLESAQRARLRETAAYLSAASIPPGLPTGLAEVPSLSSDVTLTALVQLGTLRMNCDRAFLSLIDGEYQYICAEATRTHSLVENKAAKPQDALYLGVCKLSCAFGVCPNTMKVFTDETGDWVRTGPNVVSDKSRYIINDFRLESAYMQKPYVLDFPHMVSYLEVPLVSSLGYVIGSYCVVDNQARQWNNQVSVDTMREVATSIMSHIDLVKAKQGFGRSDRLITGLGTFMGRNSGHNHMIQATTRRPITASDAPHVDIADQTSAEVYAGEDSSNVSIGTTEQDNLQGPTVKTIKSSADATPLLDNGKSSHNFLSDSSETLGLHVVEASADRRSQDPGSQQPIQLTLSDKSKFVGAHGSTLSTEVRSAFSRAASTIREAMNMDGLLFIDAVPSSFESRSVHTSSHSKPGATSMSEIQQPEDSYVEGINQIHCTELAQSTRPSSNPQFREGRSPQYQFPESMLRNLIRKFPCGGIFSADEHGPIDHDYDRLSDVNGPEEVPFMDTLKHLFTRLPNARYVIFLPLWHFQRECWFAASVGWISDPMQSMEPTDLNLLTAFGNSVMIEVSRYEALESSRAKSDFISSISHELRSPLHGIMASSELLREAIKDPQLLSMLDMIGSCGTTLLDTFDNLLDHAKINNTMRISRSGSTTSQSGSSDQQEVRLRQKSANLSVLIQDVAESVSLGYMSTLRFRASSGREGITVSTEGDVDPQHEPINSPVLIILNIEERPNWTMRLDIGAWKRIVMNLIGNSLFFTREGYIEIGLRLIDLPDTEGQLQPNISFSVKDTGIGMSSDFLKYHIFTPFAQENPLSPGTGLGLSIVQQLTTRLGGRLGVESQLGVGTTINILVPFDEDFVESTSLSAATNGLQLQYLDALKGRTVGCIISDVEEILVDRQPTAAKQAKGRSRALNLALERIARDELGMEFRSSTEEETPLEADLYLVDAHVLSEALPVQIQERMQQSLSQLSPLILLCTEAGDLNRAMSILQRRDIYQLRHIISAKKIANIFMEALRARPQVSPSSTPVPMALKEAVNTGPQAGALQPEEQDDRTAGTPKPPQSSDLALASQLASSLSLTGKSLSTSSNTSLHLLLVDDNSINLQILRVLINKLSHTFTLATNGLQAVQHFNASQKPGQRPFDLVLMDISMPIMDGFEATREIRKAEKAVDAAHACQIVAMTSLGSESSRQEAFLSGMDMFLLKPVGLREIRKLLDEMKQHGSAEASEDAHTEDALGAGDN